MKALRIYGVLFLAATLWLGSCSKTGPAGPQGEPGATGAQGPAGPAGVAGADGSIIYSGNGAPSADIGTSNDYYIDKAAAELYGPKTEAGWGDPVSIRGTQGDKGDKGDKGDTGDAGATGATGPAGAEGPAGQDGKDGSQILSGTTVPAASLGSPGDYYLNTASYTLYGPKIAGSWGSGIVLKGAKGDKGDKGDTGNANVISSGWFSIADADWVEATTGYLPLNGIAVFFGEAGDNSMIIDQNPYQIDAASTDAAILMYVELSDGSIRLAPFTYSFQVPTPTPSYYDVKFRFVIQTSGDNYLLYPVGALRGTSWDASWVIRGLQPFKWKIIVIPSANARRSSPPDPADYKATCAYYGISE